MPEIEMLSLLFDSEWYLKVYTDVAIANANPMDHYMLFGCKEGRNPNRFFDTNFYLKTYPDIAASLINPFIHYIMHGAAEGRLPRAPGQPPAHFPVIQTAQEKPNEPLTKAEPEISPETESTKAEPVQKQEKAAISPLHVSSKIGLKNHLPKKNQIRKISVFQKEKEKV